MLKQKHAITLVALIITIIVLLILAGVVINMTLGNDGIIAKAQSSVDKYQNAQYDEEIQFGKIVNTINDFGINTSYRDEPSDTINDFTFSIEETHSYSIKVKINSISTKDDSRVMGYIFYANNKVLKVTEEGDLWITRLPKDTEFNNIYVNAIDENGKMKRSSNTLYTKTLNDVHAEWKEYCDSSGIHETALVGTEGFIVNGNSAKVMETGDYTITYAWWTAGATRSSHYMQIFKNGSEIMILYATAGSKAKNVANVHLVEGDVITVKHYTDSGSYPTSSDIYLCLGTPNANVNVDV